MGNVTPPTPHIASCSRPSGSGRKKTAAAIGYEPGQATIPNADTISSVAANSGVQTMHLAGMDGNWPAMKGSADDTVENIDEQLFLENIDYLTELVQRF